MLPSSLFIKDAEYADSLRECRESLLPSYLKQMLAQHEFYPHPGCALTVHQWKASNPSSDPIIIITPSPFQEPPVTSSSVVKCLQDQLLCVGDSEGESGVGCVCGKEGDMKEDSQGKKKKKSGKRKGKSETKEKETKEKETKEKEAKEKEREKENEKKDNQMKYGEEEKEREVEDATTGPAD